MSWPSRTMTQPTRGLGVVVSRPRAASCSARAIMAWSVAEKVIFGRSGGAGLAGRTAAARARLDLADEVGEGVDVGEVAIHRRETHVGDLVEIAQFVHHQLAQLGAGDFALAQRQQACLDALDRRLDGLERDRALAQREPEAAGELVMVVLGA